MIAEGAHAILRGSLGTVYFEIFQEVRGEAGRGPGRAGRVLHRARERPDQGGGLHGDALRADRAARVGQVSRDNPRPDERRAGWVTRRREEVHADVDQHHLPRPEAGDEATVRPGVVRGHSFADH